MTPPSRHWRSYGTDPLPSGGEALDEPFSAFPSWFLRVECDRCGNGRIGQRATRSVAEPGRADAPRELIE